MSDYKKLRKLAEAANERPFSGLAAFQAAASPDVVVALLDDNERLRRQLPCCGERPPLPWFAACAARYGHGGLHQFPPLQSLYSKERCESCGNDRAAWDALLAQLSAMTTALERALQLCDVPERDQGDEWQTERAALSRLLP